MKLLRERVMNALNKDGSFSDSSGSNEDGEAHIFYVHDDDTDSDLQIEIGLI